MKSFCAENMKDDKMKSQNNRRHETQSSRKMEKLQNNSATNSAEFISKNAQNVSVQETNTEKHDNSTDALQTAIAKLRPMKKKQIE